MFLTESIRPRPRAQEPSLPFLPSTVPFASVILSTGVQISGPVHMSRSWNASGGSQVGGGLVPTYHPRTISRLYLPKYWDVAHRNRPDLSLSLSFSLFLSLSSGIEPWSTERFDSVFVDGGYVALKSRGSRFVCTRGGHDIFADSRTRVSIAPLHCYSLKTFLS